MKMEKEMKYVAPEVEVVLAEVETGFQSSNGPGMADPGHDGAPEL